jgi:hypothetical protein
MPPAQTRTVRWGSILTDCVRISDGCTHRWRRVCLAAPRHRCPGSEPDGATQTGDAASRVHWAASADGQHRNCLEHSPPAAGSGSCLMPTMQFTRRSEPGKTAPSFIRNTSSNSSMPGEPRSRHSPLLIHYPWLLCSTQMPRRAMQPLWSETLDFLRGGLSVSTRSGVQRLH